MRSKDSDFVECEENQKITKIILSFRDFLFLEFFLSLRDVLRREAKNKNESSVLDNKRQHIRNGKTKKSMNIPPKDGHKYFFGQTVVKSVNVMFMSRSFFFISLFGDYEQFMVALWTTQRF